MMSSLRDTKWTAVVSSTGCVRLTTCLEGEACRHLAKKVARVLQTRCYAGVTFKHFRVVMMDCIAQTGFRINIDALSRDLVARREAGATGEETVELLLHDACKSEVLVRAPRAAGGCSVRIFTSGCLRSHGSDTSSTQRSSMEAVVEVLAQHGEWW